MSELELATGVLEPIHLGGRMFLPSRLNMAHLAQVKAFVSKKVNDLPNPLEIVKPSLNSLSPGDRKVVLDRATELLINRTRVHSAETLETSLSAECMAFEIWLSVQQKHPDVTYEQVLAYCEQEEFETVYGIRNMITSLVKSQDKPAERNGDTMENPTKNLRVIPENQTTSASLTG